MDSNLDIQTSKFSENGNIIFNLVSSSFSLNSVEVRSHICSSLEIGCIMNIKSSNIKAQQILSFDIKNLLDIGGIYLEESYAIFKLSNFSNISSLNYEGSCFSLKNSLLVIETGNFSNYDSNCIFAVNSEIEISSSYFNNENFKNSNKFRFEFGAIYCLSCLNFTFTNSVFHKNIFGFKGGALYLESSNLKSIVKIYNVSFLSNQAIDEGGGVYFKNINAQVIDCLFYGNKAKGGAAIIYYSSLSKLIDFIFLIMQKRF